MVKAARVIVLAVAGFLAFAAAPSLAVAQDAKHCDRLTDDDAFNKCLAAASPSRALASVPPQCLQLQQPDRQQRSSHEHSAHDPIAGADTVIRGAPIPAAIHEARAGRPGGNGKSGKGQPDGFVWSSQCPASGVNYSAARLQATA